MKRGPDNLSPFRRKYKISNMPKNEHKLMNGLSSFISSNLGRAILDKNDLLFNLNPQISVNIFGHIFDCNMFTELVSLLTEEQWKKLISRSNQKILEKINKEKEEKEALEKIKDIINNDNFLKYHNISIVELVKYDKNYFLVKVYFICGAYFLEGSIKEIVQDIRHVLKANDVNVKVFCPNCSSKNLRFISHYCFCNECGYLSDPEENKLIKKYELNKLTWARILGEVGSVIKD